MYFKKIIFYLSVFTLIIFVSLEILSKNKTKEVVILYSSDAAGEIKSCGCAFPKDFGGLARRATFIKSLSQKHKNIILLDVGDVFGTPDIAGQLRVETAILAMNFMKYEAMNLGEKELTFGTNFLEKMRKISKFSFLSANIVYDDNKKLFAKPYIIKKIKGLKIGIIGILSNQISFGSPAEERKLVLISAKDTLKKYLPKLKKKANFIVVLGHLPISEAKILAGEMKDINLIISSHEGVGQVEPLIVNSTLIVQNKAQGKYIGKIILNFNEEGKMTAYHNELVSLSTDYADEPYIAKLVLDYEDKVKKGK